MITPATSKYVSASSEAKRTTVDQPQAASVPIEISVSIVARPWRACMSVTRWKGRPPTRTTGVASAKANHSQPEKWSAGIIATSASGSVSAAEKASRRTSGPWSCTCAWSCSPGSEAP